MAWSLTLLLGEWQFKRLITGSSCASVTGSARLSASGDGLIIFEEQGVLLLSDGKTLSARQSYLYKTSDQGFSVYFRDETERLFHEVFVDEHLHGEGYHLCGQDTYRTTYQFSRVNDHFTITHCVTGPKKDYLSTTSFSR